ncbi:MAG: PilZ domain-containing protein [Proteobacteria bacterium]|nr:PilZ domain-containing protein [Pseudomonadota bacterium]
MIQDNDKSMRESLRVDTRTIGQITNLSSKKSNDTVIDDISIGGVRIKIVEENSEFAKTGDPVKLSFTFPDVDDSNVENEEIIICGTIRHTSNQENGWIFFGIQATDNDATRLDKLEKTWLALMFEYYD